MTDQPVEPDVLNKLAVMHAYSRSPELLEAINHIKSLRVELHTLNCENGELKTHIIQLKEKLKEK